MQQDNNSNAENKYVGIMDVEYKVQPIANMHREHAYIRLNGERIFDLIADNRNEPMSKQQSEFAEKLATAWNEYNNLLSLNEGLQNEIDCLKHNNETA